MKSYLKKIIPIILALSAVAVVATQIPAFSFTIDTKIDSDAQADRARSIEIPLHIEDTNGAEVYDLQVITDEEIVGLSLEPIDLKKSRDVLSKGVTISSEKFSGVYEVFSTRFDEPTDLKFELAGYFVHYGNFKMVIVNNGEIISVVEQLSFKTVELEALVGDVSLIIAGESANFTFSIDPEYCEALGIVLDEQ